MERARRAIRTFFLIRDLYLKLNGKTESQLPLANPAPFVQVGDVLDLSEYLKHLKLALILYGFYFSIFSTQINMIRYVPTCKAFWLRF